MADRMELSVMEFWEELWSCSWWTTPQKYPDTSGKSLPKWSSKAERISVYQMLCTTDLSLMPVMEHLLSVTWAGLTLVIIHLKSLIPMDSKPEVRHYTCRFKVTFVFHICRETKVERNMHSQFFIKTIIRHVNLGFKIVIKWWCSLLWDAVGLHRGKWDKQPSTLTLTPETTRVTN